MRKKINTSIVLSLILALLVGAVSMIGILKDDGGKPFQYTTIRGQNVEIYGGNGLYRFDSLFKAAEFRGFNWTDACIGLPLLIIGIILSLRERLRGKILLAGLFTYYGYIYFVGVMGNAFNLMFLPWTAIASVSFFGLFFILRELDYGILAKKMGEKFPGKSMTVFSFIFGLFFIISYVPDIIFSYLNGKPPATLGHYTTLELASFELAIMAPLSFLSAILMIKKNIAGYLISTLIVIAAAITFFALNLAIFILHFGYGKPLEFQMLILTIISLLFLIVIFKNIREK